PGAKPAGDAGACKTDQNCVKCCRDSHMQENMALDEKIRACVCKLGCAGNCGTYCTGSPVEPGSACPPCQDQGLHDPSCFSSLQGCIDDGACHDLGVCVAGCL